MIRTTKTESEVTSDMYALVADSPIARAINGHVYLDDKRPLNSTSEDAVLVVKAVDASQYQTGTVKLRVYVPDIDPYGNGVLVSDEARLKELSAVCADWVDSLSVSGTRYRFDKSIPVTRLSEQDRPEWFVFVMLTYTYFGE